VRLELPEPRSVDLGGPVSYRRWDGPAEATFVMVHGLGGSNLNWVQVAPGLAGLGRVLAPDLPGFGRSPRAGRPVGMMGQRRTLSRFVSELATGQVILCGNSMGGAIAIIQAAVEPDASAGVVLSGSVFPWIRGGSPHPLVMGAFAMYRAPGLGERFVAARTRAIGPERTVRMGFGYVTEDPASIPAELIGLHVDLMRDRQADPEATAVFLEAARSMLQMGERPQIARRALDNVHCPVLVLHGRRDRLVPAAFAEAELARHPRWRGRIFPDLGHAPQMEAPGRWLAELADWYAGTLG
jgi:pimeloyl-ACP methyl ester carboxylesterase